ncbi:zinc finger CCHC-type protein [Colletotrichum tofieldiae]|uniref:Zinc finger CCHC-type protein n=1 Tax=Colletotrichum tofieldiae TaxID=708197 RepID=A0A166SBC3_9PEZI|nr:zinc finger CCHC-type protein [Colletotrichum tofieldiae]GKT61138.1 zinc finger CCHC-type protein [Colletotrichum tofieldiae]GKT68818.1 zinc finger CCHC-type protein [Colletotrichum tofieldiae]GKT88592.1 zinc finger CCHC-type protein [Colletotrichum tofieldiae]
MATPWPPEQLWPTHHREHATELSRHLQTAVKCIDTANGNPLNPQAVRATLIAALSLIIKLQNIPELGHLHQAIESLRAETKTANENTTRETRTIKIALQQNTAELKENTNTARAANEAAKEAWKASELAAKVVKDIKALGPMNQGSTAQSYASVAARGGLTGSMHNPHNQKASQTQTLREIIVNIRDPITIASIRAMNPRSLKAHVDRAIEESSNEHVRKLKPVSMDMDRFSEIRDDLLQDNKAFIPTAEIKYIGWLTRSASKKTASTTVVEFSKAEDANKLIDEGLIWQGQVVQCERYDRKCRLRQCFKCHTYGHIGTQCKATTTCGYCAQDCPSKSDTETPRKCAACHGEHEAWNGRCPTRIREKAKIRTAYNQRSRYHLEQAAPQPALGPEARTRPNPRTTRPTLDRQSQENQPTRSRSLTKKV